MATSASYNFTVTRNDIIERALRILNVTPLGEPVSNEQSEAAALALNSMIKEWQRNDMQLWLWQEAIIFLNVSQESYLLGPNGDEACLVSEYITTALSADEAAAETVLSVTDSADMTASDVVGIILDNNTLHWTTIVSVNSATKITITIALPSDAASGNIVHTYTNVLQRPLAVTNCRRRDEAPALETPFAQEISRSEYMGQPFKSNKGKPTEFYYHPQLDNGRIYVWPTADTVGDTIRCTVKMPIEDVDAAANTFDFPQEWFGTLAYGLANDMLLEVGTPEPAATRIENRAAIMKAEAARWDAEPASVQFQPNLGP